MRVQELAAPGRLTASRCMVLELGATFVDLVAVTLVSDMRSSRAITSLSEQIVAESDHSSRCSALSAALRSLGREGRPRRGLPTFVDAILKMLAGRSLIPAGLAALSNVCGLKLAAAEAEPLRGSAAELAAAFIGALATEPQLALKGFALMLKAGPAVTLREAHSPTLPSLASHHSSPVACPACRRPSCTRRRCWPLCQLCPRLADRRVWLCSPSLLTLVPTRPSPLAASFAEPVTQLEPRHPYADARGGLPAGAQQRDQLWEGLRGGDSQFAAARAGRAARRVAPGCCGRGGASAVDGPPVLAWRP